MTHDPVEIEDDDYDQQPAQDRQQLEYHYPKHPVYAQELGEEPQRSDQRVELEPEQEEQQDESEQPEPPRPTERPASPVAPPSPPDLSPLIYRSTDLTLAPAPPPSPEMMPDAMIGIDPPRPITLRLRAATPGVTNTRTPSWAGGSPHSYYTYSSTSDYEESQAIGLQWAIVGSSDDDWVEEEFGNIS